MNDYGLGDALEDAMDESGFESYAYDGYRINFNEVVSNFMNSPEFTRWFDNTAEESWR